VPGETELEDPQDLRAEIGKFPNSTNERKQMSTKTMKQRIAVVAVSALTAGFLSVVAAPVANAAVPTTEHFILGNTASTTGAATITALAAPIANADMSSVGLISSSSADLSASATATGAILETASIAVSWTTAAKSAIVVTGGTISSAVGTAAGAASLNVSGTLRSAYNSSLTDSAQAIVSPSGAAGSVMTVAVYSASTVSATTPTAGTLIGLYSLTVVAADASGSYADKYSSIYQQAAIAKTGTPAGTSAFDTTSRIANGSVGVVYIALKDIYNVAVTTGTVTATATNSSLIKLGNAAAAQAYSATSSFSSVTDDADGIMYLAVNQPVANTAGTTTVTITLGGTVLATKTFNWSGDIATLAVDTVNSNSTFANGADDTTPVAAEKGVVYVAKDAAGNAVTLAAQPTVTGATGSMVGATLYTGNNGTSGSYQTSSVGYGTSTMNVPSTSLNGAGTYSIKLTNAAGATITSPAVSVIVSRGSTNSFVASWDKATYAPGDIAVMTIAGKDVYGNPMAAGTLLAGYDVSVNSAGFTAVGSACSAASYFDSKGAVTCKYAAGNTEGSYSYSVDITTATPQSATVGAVKIAASSATVSNADVLKSIVALIASINKQIQALQALILKKK